MSLYTIQKPCAFVVDGKGVHYRKTGAVVDLDDNTAIGLGDSVSPLRSSAPTTDNLTESDNSTDDPKPRRTRKSDDG